MNTKRMYDRTSSAARAPPAGLESRLAAVNRALNYFSLTFSRKVYVQITCYKSRRLSSLNFPDDEITFARKFQYRGQIKIDEISNYENCKVY